VTGNEQDSPPATPHTAEMFPTGASRGRGANYGGSNAWISSVTGDGLSWLVKSKFVDLNLVTEQFDRNVVHSAGTSARGAVSV
jgi:hypothetical protein